VKARPLLFLIVFGAAARLFADPGVSVGGAWLRAVPPSSTATAAYMTIQNSGTSSVRLVGAETAVADSVEPMITTRKEIDGQTVVGMETVPHLKIPAGGRLTLAPGGDHLMVMGLKRRLHEGDQVTFVLVIEPGHTRLQVTLPVLRQPPAR